jgi:hypothetical protein
MSNWSKMDLDRANELTGHKVRIFVMGTAYEKLKEPKMEMKTTETGITVPTMTHYREHDTPQYAVNYNGLYMDQKQFEFLAQSLVNQLREDFKKRGIIQS